MSACGKGKEERKALSASLKFHIRHWYDSENGKKCLKQFKNHVINVLHFPKEDIKSYNIHVRNAGVVA